ncbi:MAG: hypothetical protein V1792_16060 [Pseudomonadota bacterium]
MAAARGTRITEMDGKGMFGKPASNPIRLGWGTNTYLEIGKELCKYGARSRRE